jgi:hypothetical protein
MTIAVANKAMAADKGMHIRASTIIRRTTLNFLHLEILDLKSILIALFISVKINAMPIPKKIQDVTHITSGRSRKFSIINIMITFLLEGVTIVGELNKYKLT